MKPQPVRTAALWPARWRARHWVTLSLVGCAATASAQMAAEAKAPAEATAAAPFFAPRAGVVLDLGFSSRDLALGGRDKGVRLGGAEFIVESPIGPYLEGRLAAAAHSHNHQIDKHIEEAWVGTTALPAGWQARAGRFLSQVGYLNEQHPHADDFSTRPLLYRAMLGSHFFDTGLRVNWTAPTALYWRTGVEVFSGKQLTPEARRNPALGVWTLSTKVGGDLNREQSWQLGLSYLQNRRAAWPAHEDAADGETHDHADGAQLAGRNLWIVDGVWKWAPGGNNRQEQLRLSFELARQTGLGDGAVARGSNRAAYLAAAYRFGGQWEVGARADWLSGRIPADDAFQPGRLAEWSLMAAWKPSHQQTLRVQFTQQRRAIGFDNPGRAIMLQYIHSFGAHGAHSF